MMPEGEELRKFSSTLRNTIKALGMVWQAQPLAAVFLPVCMFASAPLPAGQLYCVKKVIDGVSLWHEGMAAEGQRIIILFLALGSGAMLLRQGFGRVSECLNRIVRIRLTQHIQGQILEKAVSLDQSFFETPKFYDKIERAQRESNMRPYLILDCLVRGSRETVFVCSYLFLVAGLAWWIVPCVLLITLPGLILQVKFGRIGWLLVHCRTPEERRMGYYQSVLTSERDAKEVRLWGLASYFLSRWRETSQQFYRQDRKLAIKQCAAEVASDFLQLIAVLGFFGFAIYRTLTDPLVTVGSLVMYAQAIERVNTSVWAAFQSVAGLYENSLYLSTLFEYLAQKPLIHPPARPVASPKIIKQGLLFDSICFAYPGSSEEVLHDVSFEIRAGERIALVGENGAGKTTLIKLLARLYDPGHGRILVDGVDLRDMDPAQWQKRIGIVFQDYARYAMTARENVGFGQLEKLENLLQIRAAAELSGVTARIERLGKGWETVLGKTFSEGVELSTGEWQKVALARAFLREAQILVLDEPTASLDANQEYETFRRFSELTKDRTTILISHRFSTVRMTDRILVFEKGHLVESGSHDELMMLGERYAEMFTRQSNGYLLQNSR